MTPEEDSHVNRAAGPHGTGLLVHIKQDQSDRLLKTFLHGRRLAAFLRKNEPE
jgi:hypothetical protein